MDSGHMTTNTIQKKCPECGYHKSDITGAAIITEVVSEKNVLTSYNRYKCLKCRFAFMVKRTGDTTEQTLTEKYIKSASIKLK